MPFWSQLMKTEASVAGKIERFKKSQYDRVGLKLRAEMFAIKDTNGDAAKFSALAKKISDATGAAMIFMSDSVDVLTAAVDSLKEKKPLIYAATRRTLKPSEISPRRRGVRWL